MNNHSFSHVFELQKSTDGQNKKTCTYFLFSGKIWRQKRVHGYKPPSNIWRAEKNSPELHTSSTKSVRGLLCGDVWRKSKGHQKVGFTQSVSVVTEYENRGRDSYWQKMNTLGILKT